MNPGDEVLYPDPGYPIYESQIEYLGGIALPYGYLQSSEGFALDMETLKRSITPKTKVLIYNNYQNPTGLTLHAKRSKSRRISHPPQPLGTERRRLF